MYLEALLGCGAQVQFGLMAGYPSQRRCAAWRSSQPPEIFAAVADTAELAAKAVYEQALSAKWLEPLPPCPSDT